jgi:hypothetical protein
MLNRLAREQSPYLLQHAGNPVDWYPWGPEAFERARADDKPVFLSVGYSTCHWCHVMAHESFEDPSIAAVLNRDFVSIKVDREERPDVDRVYMTFVQATTGAGGWPMSVWLTPELRPFLGGTYYPPTSRWGRPGFVDVLRHVARTWQEDRPRVRTSAETLLARLKEATGADRPAADRAPVAGLDAIVAGVAAFDQAFDGRHGGFGGAPKFPRPSELYFLLRAAALVGDARARAMALESLHAMALGGLRDHVGGGFHRYSVDAEWRVPHFEKMLYDQAQLVLANLEAAQSAGDAFYSAVAEDTLTYVLRDLRSPDGAFYSAEDADSRVAHGAAEHREGAFYVWTADEVDRVAGAEAGLVRRRFGVEDHGNALADPQGEFTGQNLLYVAQSLDDVAARTGEPVESVMQALTRAREALFEARASRPRPHLDDKILTSWNGLMIAATARAARVLVGSPARGRYREAALAAATTIRGHLWRPDERLLLRRLRGADAAIDGFAEDYACLAWGALELFEATGGAEWLAWALDLTQAEIARFGDPHDGGWFSTTGDDPSVLLRLKEDYDGAEPSAASVTVRNLLVLGQLLNDASLVARAQATLERFGPTIGRAARVMPFMLANVAEWHADRLEIVIVGDPAHEGWAPLERTIADRYLPFAVHVPVSTAAADEARTRALTARLPWIGEMVSRGPEPLVYVCRASACQAPVSDAASLSVLLDEAAAARRVVLP